MDWRDIPGRAWLVFASMVVGFPLMFVWKDGVLIPGVGWIVGLGMTAIDVGWWPARRPY